MTWLDIVIQAIGFIGIAFNVWAVQFNKHWQIVLLKTLGSLAFVIQYVLLGAYTGAAMDGIGILRNIIFIFAVKEGKGVGIITVFFALLTVGLGIWTFEGVLSLLAICAKLLSTVGYGIKDPHKIRMINLPSSLLWLFYNGFHFSLAGILNEIFVTTSIIIAEIRFRKSKDDTKKEKNNQVETDSVEG